MNDSMSAIRSELQRSSSIAGAGVLDRGRERSPKPDHRPKAFRSGPLDVLCGEKTWKPRQVSIYSSEMQICRVGKDNPEKDGTIPLAKITQVQIEAAAGRPYALQVRWENGAVAMSCTDRLELERWRWSLEDATRLASIGIKAEHTLITQDEIKLGEAIAKGAEGSVHKAMFHDQEVAVKIMDAKKLLQSGAETDALPREVEILCSISHPNILKMLGYLRTPTDIWIITPFVDLGSLQQLLKTSGDTLSEDLRTRFALEACSALAYLHSHKIIHRDVKTANFLIKSLELDAPLHVVLADFGTARFLPSPPKPMTKSPGTLLYEAPEASTGIYDEKTDVFSFGVCLWEMYSLQAPWAELRWLHEVTKRIIAGERPKFPDNCPESSRQIIHRCWALEPAQRPSFEQVLGMLREKYILLEEARESIGLSGAILRRNQTQSLRGSGQFQPIRSSSNSSIAPGAVAPGSCTDTSAVAAAVTDSDSNSPLSTMSTSPSPHSNSWKMMLTAAGFDQELVDKFSQLWSEVPCPVNKTELPYDALKEFDGVRLGHIQKLKRWASS